MNTPERNDNDWSVIPAAIRAATPTEMPDSKLARAELAHYGEDARTGAICLTSSLASLGKLMIYSDARELSGSDWHRLGELIAINAEIVTALMMVVEDVTQRD